jgi:hypothetical protein
MLGIGSIIGSVAGGLLNNVAGGGKEGGGLLGGLGGLGQMAGKLLDPLGLSGGNQQQGMPEEMKEMLGTLNGTIKELMELVKQMKGSESV